jgi:hypothetical protein
MQAYHHAFRDCAIIVDLPVLFACLALYERERARVLRTDCRIRGSADGCVVDKPSANGAHDAPSCTR